MHMNEIVEPTAFVSHSMVVLRGGEVWVTFDRPWWDIVERVRWALTPGKESTIFLRVRGKDSRVSVKAKRISRSHIRLG